MKSQLRPGAKHVLCPSAGTNAFAHVAFRLHRRLDIHVEWWHSSCVADPSRKGFAAMAGESGRSSSRNSFGSG